MDRWPSILPLMCGIRVIPVFIAHDLENLEGTKYIPIMGMMLICLLCSADDYGNNYYQNYYQNQNRKQRHKQRRKL